MTVVHSKLSHVTKDSSELPVGSDPFEITTQNGFLPYQLPLEKLPPAFDALSNILDDMPIEKLDGEPGLLATFKLGPLIDAGTLPDLTDAIDNLRVEGSGDVDMAAVTAAFRDYSFVASAYLLEPCWESYSTDSRNGYKLGRQILPKCIAGPLVKCAEM